MKHADIWYAIEQLAAANNMSCSGLARCSGLDPTAFNKSKRWSKYGQPRWPSTYSLAKVLAATGTPIAVFADYITGAKDNK